MRKTTSFLIFLLILLWGSTACGKVYIDINSPAFQKFPVAIPEFKNIGKPGTEKNYPAWFADQLSRTLKITGFFKLISKDAFLENQDNTNLTAEEIDFSNWSSIGSDFLIKGGFSYDGSRLSVEFRLFDTIEGKLVTGKKYWGKPDEKKIMVLRFADEILMALTGKAGVFDTKIAFIGKKGNSSEVYTVNFDGSDLDRITDFNSLTLLPHWSPDGSEISFTSYKNGNPDCYIINPAKRKTRRISSFSGLNLLTSWSSNGKQALIVLSRDGNEEIYIKYLRSGKLQRLTRAHAIDVSPAWSPDGQKISFRLEPFRVSSDIYHGFRRKKTKRLTFEGYYNSSPCWSPDGTRIAYAGSSNGQFQIFTIGENGDNLMQLTFEAGGGESPSWSPDGRYLVFSSKKNGQGRICVINSNGLSLRVLPGINGVKTYQSPSWSRHLNLY